MPDNIFILVENYLVKSDKKTEAQIKQLCRSVIDETFNEALSAKLLKLAEKVNTLSLDQESTTFRAEITLLLGEALIKHVIQEKDEPLSNEAYKNEVVAYLNYLQQNVATLSKIIKNPQVIKCINSYAKGDEIHPLLEKKIKQQAEEASSLSTRLATNPHFNANNDLEARKANGADYRPYIFRLSANEKNKVSGLLSQLIDEAEHTHLPPDVLTFSFGGYMERRSASKFKYCDELEGAVHSHTSVLRLKAEELEKRGETQAAGILRVAHRQIKNICDQSNLAVSDIKFTEAQLNGITDALKAASDSPVVKTHRGVKQILANFLLVIFSLGAGLLGLAQTSGSRGSFWYRPNTDTENKLKEFGEEIMKTTRPG